MTTVLIVFILILFILGGLAYWNWDDIFGYTGGGVGDTCSIKEVCEHPLLCSNLICEKPRECTSHDECDFPLVCDSTQLTCQPAPIFTNNVDPNLLFDVNFKSDLELDVGGVKKKRTFSEEPVGTSFVVGDGFVTIPTSRHMTLELPEDLKHTGDQSWVFDLKAAIYTASGESQFVIQTSPIAEVQTGFSIRLYDNATIDVTFYKSPGVVLVTDTVTVTAAEITHVDEPSDIPSNIIVTYKSADNTLKVYFNGELKSEIVGTLGELIDWTTSDTLIVNDGTAGGPVEDVKYHRIAVYNKVLSNLEVVGINFNKLY